MRLKGMLRAEPINNGGFYHRVYNNLEFCQISDSFCRLFQEAGAENIKAFFPISVCHSALKHEAE